MPFDATTLSNPIADVVLVPLSDAAVEAHKTMMINVFRAKGPVQNFMLKSGRAKWKTEFIIHSSELVRWGAPKPVLRLARDIERQVPEAQLSIQWFDDDPILDVELHGHVMHLAIWTRRLIAIATRTHQQPSIGSRLRSFLDRSFLGRAIM